MSFSEDYEDFLKVLYFLLEPIVAYKILMGAFKCL